MGQRSVAGTSRRSVARRVALGREGSDKMNGRQTLTIDQPSGRARGGRSAAAAAVAAATATVTVRPFVIGYIKPRVTSRSTSFKRMYRAHNAYA